MHQRTCGDHQQPLWVRLRSIGACFVGGVALVKVVHTDNAHEGPEWKRAQAVLEFAAFGAPDPWAKAHIKLGDFHSTLTCGNEVPYFVQKNRDNETNYEHQCPWIRYTQPNEKTHQHNCAEHCRTLLTRAFWPIDGVATKTREQLVEAITSRSPGEDVQLEIRRDAQVIALQATLAANPVDESVAYFGVGSWSMDYVQQNLISSLGFAASDVVVDAANSVKGVFTVLNPVNIVSNVASSNADPMTRPSTVVGASQIGGEVGKQEGLKGVLMLLASINIFVGVFNMFPLLPFDGGHAAIATYERLRSRRGKEYRADVANMVPVATSVVALLALLLLAGLYLDITQPLG